MSAPRSAAARAVIRLLLGIQVVQVLQVLQVSAIEMPSITFVKESSSSVVTCHATGFYPEEAVLFWAKNGTQLQEGVKLGEILPNHDGTFQRSADLNVSSIPREDWDRYSCVFQYTETKEIISLQLDQTEIKSEITYPRSKFPMALVIAGIVGSLIIAIVFLGVCKYKQSLNNRQTLPCGSSII